MISTFTSARATRWAGGVLVVAASALGLGIGPLAATASAAVVVPTAVTISPASSTIAASGCAALTVFGTGAGGVPASGATITVQVTQSAAYGSSSHLSFCTVPGGATQTQKANSVVGGSPGFLIFPSTPGTATLRYTTTLGTATVGTNGQVNIGVSSSAIGSVGVVAYYNNGDAPDAAPATANPKSNAAAVNVVASGAAAVGHLTATPTAVTQYVGSGVSYQVRTTDSGNVPISGIAVDYVVSGPDSQAPVRQCGVNTDSTGTATCTITNGGNTGTDNVVFYVNGTGGTAGPDSGEPQAPATATFQALPPNGAAVVSATCANTDTQPTPGVACTNPVTTHAVAFTATVQDSANQPVSGVTVNWNRTGSFYPSPGPSPTSSSLSATSCVTGSAGTCSVTLTENTPGDGEALQLTASIGPSNKSAIAQWQNPVATTFTAAPPLQTVTTGGATNFSAKVVDQFGTGVANESVSYLVSAGRNAGKTATVLTGTNGIAALGYTDTGVNPAQTTDTVQIKDAAPYAGAPASLTNTVTGTVNYIAGSTNAGLIALDVSGNCNTTAPTSTNTNGVGTGTTKVCALVTNASGTKLLGKAVTFAVSTGKVDSVSPQSASAGPAVTVFTDSNGVATAYVSSTTAGTQTITAQSDSISANGTISYSTTVANLRTVKIAPVSTAFSPGTTQTFTGTALDANGNPVAGVGLLFVVNGPGTIAGGSNQLVSTAANGTASVVLTAAATDAGTGSVTVSVPNDTATQCHATGGTCSAVATYTVQAGASSSAGLLLYPQKNVTAGGGNAEGVEAVALNSDGSAAPNQVIRFKVTGANPATGAETTAASGAAVFAYNAANAGTDTIFAYDDLNDNGTQDAGEPSATVTATIFPAGCTTCGGGGGTTKTEHPKLTISQTRSSSKQEKLTLSVTSSPALANAKVTFYQVKHGVRHKIGAGTTGTKGKVKGTLKAAHGLHLKFQAKVTGKAGVKSGFSKVVSVHVK